MYYSNINKVKQTLFILTIYKRNKKHKCKGQNNYRQDGLCMMWEIGFSSDEDNRRVGCFDTWPLVKHACSTHWIDEWRQKRAHLFGAHAHSFLLIDFQPTSSYLTHIIHNHVGHSLRAVSLSQVKTCTRIHYICKTWKDTLVPIPWWPGLDLPHFSVGHQQHLCGHVYWLCTVDWLHSVQCMRQYSVHV